MAEGKLTALKVKALTRAGHHGDGGGLYLRIAEGRRSWMFRYKRGKKTFWLGLGPENDVPLARAREAARQCREQLRQGVDPLESRRAARAAAIEAGETTFQLVAERYIAAHEATWRNAKHRAQWSASLEAYVYPVLGARPVAAITTRDVLDVLEAIWSEKPETASRVRGRIETVLDYATSRHLRAGENPARWRGHLQHSLPARAKVAKVEHHAALPWAELPRVMDKLMASKGTAALCLRFLILTAARSGEARGAKWREIDTEGAVWTIPAERMKAGRDHRVPLSAPALAVLNILAPLGTEPERLIFEGGRKDKPLSDVATTKALKTAGAGDVTVHGLRSTFRDWCAERTNYPREVAETALAHVNKDRVESAYLRGDHFEQRRRLMGEWAKYATGSVEGGTVTSIGGRRA